MANSLIKQIPSSFTDYGLEAQNIERQRKLGEMLSMQASEGLPVNRMAGNTVVPIAWSEGLSQALKGYQGAQKMNQATEQERGLGQRFREQGTADADQFMQAMQAGDKQKALSIAMQSQNPMVAGAGQSMLAQMLKAQEPVKLRADEKLYGPDGKVIVENVKPQPGFTAKPGDIRFDANGKQIVAVPEKVDPNKPFIGVGQPNLPYQEYAKDLASRSGTRVNVSNDMRAENAYASGAGAAAIKRDNAQHEAAVAAPVHLAKLDETLKELKTGKAITGMGSQLLKEVERARVLIAQDKAAGKKVSDTEYLDSLLGSDVFPLIQQLGIGARGMDTPAEREFLRAVMTGTTNLNKETLVRMTESRRRNAQNTLDNFNKRVVSGELDDYFNYSKLKKEPIKYNPQSAAPSSVGLPSQDAINAELEKRKREGRP